MEDAEKFNSVRRELFHLIELEREAQDAKWGKQEHPNERWMIIVMEELGEASKAILEGHPTRMTIELVQAMAVIMAWLEWYLGTEDIVRSFRIHWDKPNCDDKPR